MPEPGNFARLNSTECTVSFRREEATTELFYECRQTRTSLSQVTGKLGFGEGIP
jgi:hypothetical protein